MRPHVGSHLNAKVQNWQWAGIYFFQEKLRHVQRIAGLLISYNVTIAHNDECRIESSPKKH